FLRSKSPRCLPSRADAIECARARNCRARHFEDARRSSTFSAEIILYQDSPCATDGSFRRLSESRGCHQTVMYTVAPEFTCVTCRILLIRSDVSHLLISFSNSISLPLNIVIFIVATIPARARYRNRNFDKVKPRSELAAPYDVFTVSCALQFFAADTYNV